MGAERTRWESFPFRGIERLFGCAQTLLDRTAANGYTSYVREGGTMKALTVQKVTTVVRKTGIGTSNSHATRVRGFSSISYGTTVKTNGEVRYICARCSHGGGYHHEWCTRRHLRWNRRTIADGTFSVTLDRGFSGFLSDRSHHDGAIARDSATLEAAFDAAGLAWVKASNASVDSEWVITGYAQEEAA